MLLSAQPGSAKFNIIGDIAGRYNELIKLLSIMPPCDKIILVGDLVDRGPDSKKVVELAMKGEYNGVPIVTIKGNHEDMFVGMYETQAIGFPQNGQQATLKSYGVTDAGDLPESHVEWMNSLPLCFRSEGLFVSHAPWVSPKLPETPEDLEDLNYGYEQMILWNRNSPLEVPGMFQVFGHNSKMEKYGDWGYCIDASSQKVLTGITFPNKTIFQVEYE